jgi:hypothetical protein
MRTPSDRLFQPFASVFITAAAPPEALACTMACWGDSIDEWREQP